MVEARTGGGGRLEDPAAVAVLYWWLVLVGHDHNDDVSISQRAGGNPEGEAHTHSSDPS